MAGYSLAQVSKAIAALVLAAASVIAATLNNGGTLTQTVWIQAAVAGVIAGVGVFLIPNAPATPKVAPTVAPVVPPA